MTTFWEAVARELGTLPSADQTARFIVRIFAAVLFGGILGWERERIGKPAGLRTHMLVSLGAALFVLLACESGISKNELSRVIQGVITGIGFIGGGTILKLSDRMEIRGITTATSIWLAAAMGVAAGLGWTMVGLLIVGLAYTILRLLQIVERRIEPQKNK